MELVEGKTLDRLLREGRMDLARAVRVVREIAEGLSEAHAQGIVHRDLKATNVMVTAAGRVKILDFGLAKSWQGDVDQEISTPGTVVGTCHAMSPEQAQGLAVDHRSDLFSLGSLLYELLTGLSPFHAGTPTETLARICAFEPDPVTSLEPAVPPALADLTHRLLRKSAAQRPQGSWEVAAALERIERAGGLDQGARRPVAPAVTEVFTQVERPSGTPAERSSPPPLTSTERRQMTVLCCELADAASPGTEPGQAFDPESLYELMLQLRPLALQAVQRYDGTLGTAMGHRLLVYFGYPQAHEDDAWRAVRTGLDLVGEVEAQLAAAPGLGRVRPALRVRRTRGARRHARRGAPTAGLGRTRCGGGERSHPVPGAPRHGGRAAAAAGPGGGLGRGPDLVAHARRPGLRRRRDVRPRADRGTRPRARDPRGALAGRQGRPRPRGAHQRRAGHRQVAAAAGHP
jgi:hypothetical protein